MRYILWGTDETVNDTLSRLAYMNAYGTIAAAGTDKENYPYHILNGGRQLDAEEVIKLVEQHQADGVLLAADIRYLKVEYEQLMQQKSIPVYAVPSYLFRKKELEDKDRAAVFTPYKDLLPQLYYLEFHAADHCNLKCKGCTHFSNIVPDGAFPDLKELEKSFRRLSELFQNIEFIRIMGGEPLLNPRLDRILQMARQAFPWSKIILVTNGLLFRQMPKTLLHCLRELEIQVTVSVYPPIQGQRENMEHFFLEQGIAFQFGERQNEGRVCDRFTKFMDMTGRQNPVESWKSCRRRRCTFLYHGKLYGCAMPALLPYFNDYFKTQLPCGDGIDIFDKELDGYSIQNELLAPHAMCAYCGREEEYEWDITRGEAKKSDWCIY